MYLYKKTATPRNTAGKITALLLLLCGGALFILAANFSILPPSIIQFIGVILIGISIYIASAYLLREYTFSIPQSNLMGDESYKESFDLVITEKKNNRDIKVCHFSMSDVTLVQTVNPKNRKQILQERKKMQRYTYNTEFAASRHIEVRATLDGDDYSIFMTYDEDLLRILESFFEEQSNA
jgi:hypothetical protein